MEHLAQEAERMAVYPSVLFPPSVYYRFLYALTRYVKPRVSVELGLCGGGGSLHMALGYPQGTVIGIDTVNAYPENVRHIQSRCPNFEFWITDSVQAAQSYPATGRPPVGVLFIDTVHTYDRTMLEFNAWRNLLSKDAIVVLDDLHRTGMDRAWNEIPGRKIRLDTMHLSGSPTDGGFGVVWDIDR